MPQEDITALELSAEALERSLGGAAQMAASFDGELTRVRAALAATGEDAKTLERGLSRGLRRAFDGLAFDGKNLSEALETAARSVIRTTYNAALRPVTNQASSLLTDGLAGLVGNILPFADGAPFSQGRVTPFARGGVVSSPTHFPMRGGLGLMGEAGPEAILPLARGADGSLGVRSAGGSAGPTIVMNIQTPDAQSFQRSQGQIAAQMSRALSRGNRNR
ncbi:phage tail tape measure protein [Epibacterium sp. SM1979]|uniref:Phage tail tape measure protein n=1 Tax=Tritonibacter litoralis TaxID=2662264 RepID=A0A843YBB3_9RHOB|nr:phage tail tape measure protein [Tritonibacter litoralis]MQQ06955.1 phage tail tape measure protein [Tritonibacter litoralis]